MFEAVVGTGGGGSFSLDDVEIQDGACPPEGFCDFERDMCGWTNDHANDDFDWLRDTAGTPSGTTGPPYDHTTGTAFGRYH